VPLYEFLNNLLNALVQIANKMGLQDNVQAAELTGRDVMQDVVVAFGCDVLDV
jgi:hypothetical protein